MASNQRRTRLGILFGGRSGEHEVSLSSAASVIAALDAKEYELTAIGITKSGLFATEEELESMLPRALLGRVRLYGHPGGEDSSRLSAGFFTAFGNSEVSRISSPPLLNAAAAL